MSQQAILNRLRHGPATNAELQEAVIDHTAGIARTCNKLIKQNRVKRIDGGKGRGSRATYAIVIANVNAPVGSPERAAWQNYENRRAQAIVERVAVASNLGFDEDHSPVDARHPGRGSIKRSHRAEGRNWVD